MFILLCINLKTVTNIVLIIKLSTISNLLLASGSEVSDLIGV